MPCLFAIFANAFRNEVVAICCENVLYLREENFHSSLKICKKPSLGIDLSKFSKIMRHYAFFFRNCANYALRAELCDFTSVHNSGSPVIGHQVVGFPTNLRMLATDTHECVSFPVLSFSVNMSTIESF